MQKSELVQTAMVAEDVSTLLEDDAGATIVDAPVSIATHGKNDHQVYAMDNPTQYAREEDTVPSDSQSRETHDAITKRSTHGPAIKRLLTGEEVQLTKSGFVFGRKEGEVDFAISHNPAISRKHAEIVVRKGLFYLHDLGAKNGTFINEQLIPAQREHVIHNGDVIKLANEDFIFLNTEG